MAFLAGLASVVGGLLLPRSIAFDGRATSADAGDTILLDDLQVGECFDDHLAIGSVAPADETLEVTFVDRLPCDEPHRLELFDEFEVVADDETFGDVDALLELGFDGCVERFEPIIGRSYMESELDVTTYVAEYDTTIQCAAVRMDGEPLTASVIGSGL